MTEKARKQKYERDQAWRKSNRDKVNARDRAWRKRNPESGRAAGRKYRLGLTRQMFNARLEAQNNKCAVCKNLINLDKVHVDHNHETGQVRGILCVRCNLLLGMAKDNKQILQAAIDYLNVWGLI